MTGKVLQHLLQEQRIIYLNGIGTFSLEAQSAEIQPGTSLILPPVRRIDFQAKASRHQTLNLSECLQLNFGLPAWKADELENAFLSEIRDELATRRKFTINGFGTLLADSEGNLQFYAEEAARTTGEEFGLRPVAARLLALRHSEELEKETPVIPLRPFEFKEKARPKSYRMLAYAASISLLLAGGSLFWLKQGEVHYSQQASVLQVPLASQPEQTEKNSPYKPEVSPIQSEIQISKETASISENLRYYVVAGSFKVVTVAEDARIAWKKEGYDTKTHVNTTTGMIRISIGNFASKEEALQFLEQKRSLFTASLWILSE